MKKMPDEPNWRDALPDELKEHKGLTDVKDVGSLAQQFIDAQATMGNSIRIPGPEAGDDAWKAFHEKLTTKVPNLIPTPDRDNEESMNALYKTLGRPEDATGYEHPDGVDASQLKDFAELAHKIGLSKGQYGQMIGALAQHTVAQTEAASEAFMTAVRELKQEWGIVYEDNIQLVDSVMKGTGAPKEMLELAGDGKLPPETTKWLFEIGKQLGTEGINFNKDEFSTRVTPVEAKARVEEIMSDTKGPYWDGAHPQHAEYVQRVVDLNRAAAAGGL
jgi:hypothetical protein